jgi:hypothetical protein
LEAAKKAAEERAAAAEASEATALAARDAAEAAKLALEALNAELTAKLTHETERADGVTGRLTLTVINLAKATKRVKALEVGLYRTS